MNTACDILLRADACLTQDQDRTVVQDAALAVHDGRVLALGAWDDIAPGLAPGLASDQILDLRPGLIMPGLVNAHTHAAMTIFRGLADDLPLMPWLRDHIWPREARLTPDMVGIGSCLACAEMIRTGTTCFADMYILEAETARAVVDSGLRAVLGEGILAFPTRSYATPQQAFEVIRGLMEEFPDQARITWAVAHHAVYTNTGDILRQGRDLAEERGLAWMIHLAETKQETQDCLAAHGLRPLAWLDSLGCLGPRSALVHCVDLEPGEIERLAETGAHVIHSPQSNMKLANGFAPVQAMLKAEVNVALGTDGAASNNDLNMFTEMAAAALLQKVHLGDPTALPAQAVLDMATLGGAAALGRPDLGRLVPGGPADLAVLDLSRPNMQPLHNPVSQAVYATSGHEVRLTMVAGRILFRDGVFLSIDHQALLLEAGRAQQWTLGQKAEKTLDSAGRLHK